MYMPKSRKTYTTKQLQRYKDSINTKGVSGAIDFYDDAYSKDYKYAGWGRGVAKNDTVTGKSATDYMIQSAKEGVGGKAPKNLTTTDINNIKQDMALGYVNSLLDNAKKTGFTRQDVDYEQTRAFHKRVFEENGLSIDNWTLETPMKVIEGFEGKDAVEATWRTLRDTGGEGATGIGASYLLYDKMTDIDNKIFINPTAEEIRLQKLAREWLKRLGPSLSWKNIKNLGGAVFGVSSQLGGSQQSQLTAISKGPSIYWSSHKKNSTIGLVVYQTMDNAINAAKHTTFNGQPAYLLAKTTQPTCQGDATGRGGGVRSGTIGKEVKPTGGSSTIFVEGKALVRQGDTCTMNNGNTTGSYVV